MHRVVSSPWLCWSDGRSQYMAESFREYVRVAQRGRRRAGLAGVAEQMCWSLPSYPGNGKGILLLCGGIGISRRDDCERCCTTVCHRDTNEHCPCVVAAHARSSSAHMQARRNCGTCSNSPSIRCSGRTGAERWTDMHFVPLLLLHSTPIPRL